MTDLDAQLFSVGVLLDHADVSYEIPIYQRNYAWRMEHIEQLIEDVWSAAKERASSYFLGNLIVAPGSRSHDGGRVVYEVVDGQQRLTTLFMLLRYLAVEPRTSLTYESRRAATDALAGLTGSEVDEGASIQAGFKAIKSRMAGFTSSEQAEFATFLQERVQMVRAVLPAHTDLNRYFEVMNTRGQQLTQVDIVKARLMSYLQGRDVDMQRGCFAWVWEACSAMDSYIQMSLAPSRTALRSEIFGDTWDRLQPFSFGELVSVWDGEFNASTEHAVVYEPMTLDAALEHNAQAAPTEPIEDDDNVRFESPIVFAHLLLHTLKTLDDGGDGSLDEGQLDDTKLIKLFEAAFEHATPETKSIRAQQFVMELIRVKFVLDNYVLKREYTARNAEDGAWSLKRLIRGRSSNRPTPRYVSTFAPLTDESDGEPIDDRTHRILLLQSMLRVTYTAPKTMHWLTDVLRQPVEQVPLEQAAESLEQKVREFARSRVREAFFERGDPVGFAIERIVFTYLDYLLALGAYPEYEADRSFVFRYRNSIEHFFPQCPDPEQRGWDAVVVDAPQLQLLGNLALISVGANSKFSNNLPRQKASFYEMVKQSPKLDLMARIAQREEWGTEAIERHHDAMREILADDVGWSRAETHN